MTHTAPATPSARVRAIEHAPVVYRSMAAYAGLAVVLMAARGVGMSGTHAALVAIVAVSLTVRCHPVVWDWLPFLFLIVMFQDLASEARAVSGVVHPELSITLERALFGGPIASGWLQAHLGGVPGARAASSAFAVEYLLSDLAPIGIGVFLWLRHREAFRAFLAADVLVHVVGFTVYMLFPEMPPWMAARQGFVPPLQRQVVDALGSLPGGLGTLYTSADPAPNAAMPSLHVAIPALAAAMLLRRHGWRNCVARLAVLWTASIAVGVVYCGEHYIADAVAGALLGLGCATAGDRTAERSAAGSRTLPEALQTSA